MRSLDNIVGSNSRSAVSGSKVIKSPTAAPLASLISHAQKPLFFTTVVAAVALASTRVLAVDLMTWNTSAGSVESLAPRLHQIEALGQEVRSKTSTGELPEIAVFDEVTSYAAAASVARALGYKEATLAISDSGSDKEIWPFALEVAIVTTRKVKSVTAYQSDVTQESREKGESRPPFVLNLATGELLSGGDFSVENLDIPPKVGAAAKEAANQKHYVPRAVLKVVLDDDVVVYGVHLVSSGLGICRLEGPGGFAPEVHDLINEAKNLGLNQDANQLALVLEHMKTKVKVAENPGIEGTKQETLRRARQREAAAGAIAKLAANDITHGNTVLVAGDFNTPLFEQCKTGMKVDEDFEPLVGCKTGQTPKTCGGTDGFDDTFSILTSGLIDGVSFKVLTKDIGHTFVSGAFSDSPIDNVLISNPLSTAFEAFKLGSVIDKTVYGSDHFPVLVRQK
jgi:hypothetical protein